MTIAKRDSLRHMRITSDSCVETTEPDATPSFTLTRSSHFIGARSGPSRFHAFSKDPFYDFPVINASGSTDIEDRKSSTSLVSASEFTRVERSSLKDILEQLQDKSPFPSEIGIEVSQDSSLIPNPPEEVEEQGKDQDSVDSMKGVPGYATIFDSKCSLLLTVEESILSNEEALCTGISVFRTFDDPGVCELLPEIDSEESVLLYKSGEALLHARRAGICRYSEEMEEASFSVGEEPRHGAATQFFAPGDTASKHKLAHPQLHHITLYPLPPKVLDTTMLTTGSVLADLEETVSVPDSASPICRKLVICREKAARHMEVTGAWACSGFQTALALEYSDLPDCTKATFSGHAESILQLMTVSMMERFVNVPVAWLSCGFEHCCLALVDGSVYTWGNGGSGCLGHGDIVSHSTPKRIDAPKMRPVIYLECGAYHNAAVTVTGELWTWGRGDVHQLGINLQRLTKDKVGYVALLPVKVEDFELAQKRIKAVACGEAHTLVLDHDGQLYAFGWAEDGQLGMPEEFLKDGQSSEIRVIPALKSQKIMKIAAGALFSACINSTGGVYSWGNGDAGQLGFGPDVRSVLQPRLHIDLYQETMLDLICGESSVLCLSASHKVFGWGKGLAGRFRTRQFPSGSELVRCAPILISDVDIAHKVIIPRKWIEGNDALEALSPDLESRRCEV